jgi:hypothetical protein
MAILDNPDIAPRATITTEINNTSYTLRERRTKRKKIPRANFYTGVEVPLSAWLLTQADNSQLLEHSTLHELCQVTPPP